MGGFLPNSKFRSLLLASEKHVGKAAHKEGGSGSCRCEVQSHGNMHEAWKLFFQSASSHLAPALSMVPMWLLPTSKVSSKLVFLGLIPSEDDISVQFCGVKDRVCGRDT